MNTDADDQKLQERSEAGQIPNGIYYIVLADLIGSTQFGVEMGNEALAARICTFVTAAKEAP